MSLGMLESLEPLTLLIISLLLIIWSVLWFILPFILIGMNSRMKEIETQLARVVDLMEAMEGRTRRDKKSTFSAGER